ncbi:DsbA family protein [Novosphingobium sp.]|uniref:DsbA family protein n=1 Tax=Novosphingobium sp. TaxID=1874826 RepID=UPI001EBFE5FE|nr:DsbA family protein [Novosphingobium sp.]MBK6802969.1 thioredoxin domain-containing protein [Novosphingobium sp.]MBK9012181.1 thioredoxin domain-containing protein [Novosphingobium sp.]
MTQAPARSPSTLVLALAGTVLLLLGAIGGWLFESRRMEQAVRTTLLENPEILPEAMQKLRERETGKQVDALAAKLTEPFPGAVLGNPQGKVTLVEFTDFACTYCRASVAEVEALIAANPDLRVVVRDMPILSPQSAEAARMGLAAAEQGKYAAFHKAMFAAGRPDARTIAEAARSAGLDMERARKVIADPKTDAELAANLDYARQLGFDGTPSWVIGDQAFSGAVGRDVLQKAITEARES